MVADRLAPLAALELTHGRILHVGKTPGDHTVEQADINEILVAEAQAGNRVVRLKGGDPFVLGRGGEELMACLAAGIDVEVVPGITSAVAVPAAAGIPVTHRGMATGFLVATAHGEDPALAAHLAAIPPEITIVLLMGVRSLPMMGWKCCSAPAIRRRAHRDRRSVAGPRSSARSARPCPPWSGWRQRPTCVPRRSW